MKIFGNSYQEKEPTLDMPQEIKNNNIVLLKSETLVLSKKVERANIKNIILKQKTLEKYKY